MEKQNWVKNFVAIIFWTPVQYLIGGFNISLQNIEPGFRILQNILDLQSSILRYQILCDTRYVKNAWKIACHHAGIYCYKDIYILSLCKTKRMFKYCCFISAELYVDKRSMHSLSPPFSETILLCKILMFLLLNVFSKLFDSKIE